MTKIIKQGFRCGGLTQQGHADLGMQAASLPLGAEPGMHAQEHTQMLNLGYALIADPCECMHKSTARYACAGAHPDA
eukprot:1157054-Pelagomonas_calceolata.AAC.5